MKRYIALLLIFATAFITLSSCKKEEKGTVEDVEIIAGEAQDENEAEFEKQENPFGDYSYRTVEFDCAKMEYEIPKSWKEEICNQSCIKYSIPENDKHFPGVTFYIKAVYDYSAPEDSLDEFANHANEFGKIMSPYITGLPFKVEGKDAWIKSYSAADTGYTPDYCEDESEAVIKVTKDVLIIDKNTATVQSFDGHNFVAAYIRWENTPIMMAMTCPYKYTSDAKKMLEYILSGAKHVPHKIKQTKGYAHGNMRLTVPVGFEGNPESGNILMATPKDIKSYSAMTLGVFALEDEVETMSGQYFQDYYANTLTEMLIDPSCAKSYSYSAYASEKDASLPGAIKEFKGTVTILPTVESYKYADMTYGAVGAWNLDAFITERSGKNYLIAAMYPPNESDIAPEVEKMILETLAFTKEKE